MHRAGADPLWVTGRRLAGSWRIVFARIDEFLELIEIYVHSLIGYAIRGVKAQPSQTLPAQFRDQRLAGHAAHQPKLAGGAQIGTAEELLPGFKRRERSGELLRLG